MTGFEQMDRQQYINLETFRKSGVGVRTPVWFVQDGTTLFVRTVANSGKVKRIRNNGQVNLAACKMDGALMGEWIAAEAREVQDSDTDQKVSRLLNKKYGVMNILFSLASRLQRRKSAVLEIKVRG